MSWQVPGNGSAIQRKFGHILRSLPPSDDGRADSGCVQRVRLRTSQGHSVAIRGMILVHQVVLTERDYPRAQSDKELFREPTQSIPTCGVISNISSRRGHHPASRLLSNESLLFRAKCACELLNWRSFGSPGAVPLQHLRPRAQVSPSVADSRPQHR